MYKIYNIIIINNNTLNSYKSEIVTTIIYLNILSIYDLFFR